MTFVSGGPIDLPRAEVGETVEWSAGHQECVLVAADVDLVRHDARSGHWETPRAARVYLLRDNGKAATDQEGLVRIVVTWNDAGKQDLDNGVPVNELVPPGGRVKELKSRATAAMFWVPGVNKGGAPEGHSGIFYAADFASESEKKMFIKAYAVAETADSSALLKREETRRSLEKKLTDFYTKHDASKLSKVADLAAKYIDHENVLFQKLRVKYGAKDAAKNSPDADAAEGSGADKNSADVVPNANESGSTPLATTAFSFGDSGKPAKSPSASSSNFGFDTGKPQSSGASFSFGESNSTNEASSFSFGQSESTHVAPSFGFGADSAPSASPSSKSEESAKKSQDESSKTIFADTPPIATSGLRGTPETPSQQDKTLFTEESMVEKMKELYEKVKPKKVDTVLQTVKKFIAKNPGNPVSELKKLSEKLASKYPDHWKHPKSGETTNAVAKDEIPSVSFASFGFGHDTASAPRSFDNSISGKAPSTNESGGLNAFALDAKTGEGSVPSFGSISLGGQKSDQSPSRSSGFGKESTPAKSASDNTSIFGGGSTNNISAASSNSFSFVPSQTPALGSGAGPSSAGGNLSSGFGDTPGKESKAGNVTSAFGGGSAGTFGQGTNVPAFGSPAMATFGSTDAGSKPSQVPSAFGGSSMPAFGTSTSAFGSPAAPAFGSTSSPSSSGFASTLSASNTDWNAELTTFYEKHQPDKLAKVSSILKKYKGYEVALFKKLHKKYSVTDPIPGSTSFAAASNSAFGGATGASAFGGGGGFAAFANASAGNSSSFGALGSGTGSGFSTATV